MKGRVRPFDYMAWAQSMPMRAKVQLTASGMEDAALRGVAEEIWSEPLALETLVRRDTRPQHINSFVARVAERYGVAPEHVAPSLGASQAILHALLALVRAGDHVIVERPTYEALHRVPTLLGADVSRLERKFEEGWSVVPERLAMLLTPKTRVVILSSLHNPSGVGIPTATLQAIGEMAARVGAMVLVDEVYLDFCFDASGEGQYTPAAMAIDNGISWSSTTKTFGFSALRAGWIVTRDADAARAIRDASAYLHVDVPVSCAVLGERVLERAAPLTAQAVEASQRGLDVVRGWLEGETRVSWVEPEGGICGLIRLPELLSDQPFVDHLLGKYETLVVPGSMFEAPGTVRLGFGMDPATLETGLANMSRALDDLV